MTNDCLDIFTRPRHALTETVWTAPDRTTRIECTIESNPAPAIVCSLRSLRYVMVNRSFLALTSSLEDDWLHRSVYERDIFKNIVNCDLVKSALVNAQTIPQTPANLTMPDKTSRRVIVTGQPVTVAGQPCMLFALTDIDAWQETERRHDQYRTSVEAAFANSSACMMIVDAADNSVSMANESLCSLIGCLSDDLVGRSIDDIDIWPSGIASGFVRAKSGKLLECHVSHANVTLAHQTYTLWTFQDVTNRRIDERNLAAAIEATMSESKWLSHAILDNLTLRSEPSHGSARSGLNDLTAREREVLTLICEGMDDKTMARALNVSGNTVRNHVARVYSKIGVNRRVAAAAWGRARGFDGGAARPALP
ncbi:LuxR C-terminal-related transcriptional regulator [Sphingomonas sp. LB3N6]|uniref:LuxR C-terminal-related transcriptional regulator n=1 Tax=Sphingomonas fucosidasi TaxID=3096164 RepID=UPI002FC646DE